MPRIWGRRAKPAVPEIKKTEPNMKSMIDESLSALPWAGGRQSFHTTNDRRVVCFTRRNSAELPPTTDLSSLTGRRLLVLVDEDNLRISMRHHCRPLSYRRLLGRLRGRAENIFPLAVLTAPQGDQRREAYLKTRGWRVLAIPRETVVTCTGPQIKANADAVQTLAISPDGRTLATAGKDKSIRVWELGEHPKRIGTLDGHQGAITGLAFTEDGQSLLSASEDRSVRTWDPHSMQPRAILHQIHTVCILVTRERLIHVHRRDAAGAPVYPKVGETCYVNKS